MLLRRRFDALRPLLSPQVLDAEHPLPFLRNREQYVLVRFAGKRGGAGLIPTTQLPKFFRLTGCRSSRSQRRWWRTLLRWSLVSGACVRRPYCA